MLIDRFMPEFDFQEFHSKQVNYHPDIYEQMLTADFSRSFLIKNLFRLRGIRSHVATIFDMTKFGFGILDEKTGEEIVLGMISTSPIFNKCRIKFSPQEFLNDKDPLHIKAVINFRISHLKEYSIISTETRVLCGSSKMKNQFRLYWFFVEPFSSLIRRQMLGQIKKQLRVHSKYQGVL